MGRPTKCTPEIAEKVRTALAAGSSLSIAAKFAGIHRDSLADWLRRGEAGEDPFADFSATVRNTQGAVQARVAAKFLEGALKDPKLALAWLSRFVPEDFARTDKHEVTGANGGPIDVVSVRAAILARLAAVRAARGGS